MSAELPDGTAVKPRRQVSLHTDERNNSHERSLCQRGPQEEILAERVEELKVVMVRRRLQ